AGPLPTRRTAWPTELTCGCLLRVRRMYAYGSRDDSLHDRVPVDVLFRPSLITRRRRIFAQSANGHRHAVGAAGRTAFASLPISGDTSGRSIGPTRGVRPRAGPHVGHTAQPSIHP